MKFGYVRTCNVLSAWQDRLADFAELYWSLTAISSGGITMSSEYNLSAFSAALC